VRNNSRYARFRSNLLVFLVCLLLSEPISIGQMPVAPADNSNSALKLFLQKRLSDPIDGPDKTTRFWSAMIKSHGIKKDEIVVYFSGRLWCGSGGCSMLILEPDGATFKVIGEETIVRPPIRVLRSQSNGHFDIGVWVQGGGIQPGYEAQLRFDGKSYPSNPSVAPARRLAGTTAGRVLIAGDDEGDLLYK
jgi:hypothetical protein